MKPLDQIHIRDLALRCVIGFNDWERRKMQEVLINLTLHCDLSKATKSDDKNDTVDYKVVKDRVKDLVEHSAFHLIERLAEVIAAACLENRAVRRVDVTVDKPGALRFSRSVAVTISREQTSL